MYLPKKERGTRHGTVNEIGRNNKKALVVAIKELTSEKAVYCRMPTCNYDIGDIAVLKDGSIDFPDGSDIIKRLTDMGFTADTHKRN